MAIALINKKGVEKMEEPRIRIDVRNMPKVADRPKKFQGSLIKFNQKNMRK